MPGRIKVFIEILTDCCIYPGVDAGSSRTANMLTNDPPISGPRKDLQRLNREAPKVELGVRSQRTWRMYNGPDFGVRGSSFAKTTNRNDGWLSSSLGA